MSLDLQMPAKYEDVKVVRSHIQIASHLHFRKDLLPNLNYPSERHLAVYPLLRDSFLSSAKEE